MIPIKDKHGFKFGEFYLRHYFVPPSRLGKGNQGIELYQIVSEDILLPTHIPHKHDWGFRRRVFYPVKDFVFSEDKIVNTYNSFVSDLVGGPPFRTDGGYSNSYPYSNEVLDYLKFETYNQYGTKPV